MNMEQHTLIRDRFVDDAAPELESTYMIALPVKFTGKTWIYNICSKGNGNILGVIKWHGPWRQYWFEPERDTGFNYSCGMDIFGFVKALMDERSYKRRQM